jgi:cell wall-associated NlpC family hydrolase
MSKILSYFSKNPKIKYIIIIIIAGIFLLYNNTDGILTKKLNDNKSLVKKYKEFKTGGINKKIAFPKEIMEQVIDTAKSYIGTPNKIGGITRDSIDASGLVYISINKNSEIKFPRIAQEMARYGKIILKPKKLKRGDLVFFFDTYEIDRIITSVGIYLGDGKFINSSSNNGVSISEINDPYYWKEKFFYGTRIFK